MKRALLLLAVGTALTMGAHAQQPKSRWLFIAYTAKANEPVYVDTQTVQYPRYRDTRVGDYVKFWEKVVTASGMEITQFELHLPSRRFRVLAGTEYNAAGDVVRSAEGPTGWTTITPDSIMERIYDAFLAVNTPASTPAPLPGSRL